MPHCVLDVVAEHPQKQHVADEMEHVRMEEHVGEERRALVDGETIVR